MLTAVWGCLADAAAVASAACSDEAPLLLIAKHRPFGEKARLGCLALCTVLLLTCGRCCCQIVQRFERQSGLAHWQAPAGPQAGAEDQLLVLQILGRMAGSVSMEVSTGVDVRVSPMHLRWQLACRTACTPFQALASMS